MLVRLNKFLSEAGIASRREADRMIADGRVRVNGRVIQDLSTKIDEEKDHVEVDKKRVRREKAFVYIMLNKPQGYLVTLKDPFRRPTVMDLLPHLDKRVFPVGRLDLDSEGLLVLTNDGELAHRLMHPRFEIKKVYLIKIDQTPDPSRLARLRKGIFLEDRKTAPVKIAVLSSHQGGTRLRIEIHEGRKRELRKMFEAVGYRIQKLKRMTFAGLPLGKLKKGQWRYLTQDEVKKLKKLTRLT